MGLDITGYSKVILDDNQSERDMYDIYIDHHKAFPEHSKPFLQGKYYRTEGLKYGFRAGSYWGYNQWRKQLCNVIYDIDIEEIWDYPEKYKNKPFFNLINFSDCNGEIGTEMSKSLAKDFKEHQHIIDELSDKYFHFKHAYTEWRKVFELASDDGIVLFH